MMAHGKTLGAALLLAGLAACSGGHGAAAVTFVAAFGADARFASATNVADNHAPHVCCDGLNVYVVWHVNETDIYFNRSEDGGLTWLADDVLVSTDPPGVGGAYFPKICCAGQRLYVAWEDSRDAGSRDEVRFNSSDDGGLTWQPADIRVDRHVVGDDEADDVRICCAGLRVYVVWRDDRDGNDDIYCNVSDDGGATWQANDIRIDRGDAPGASSSFSPQIRCDGLRAYVVWADERDGGPDIYFNSSADGGATWLANDVRVDTGDALGDTGSDSPEFCCDGLRVNVAWRDSRNDPANRDIYTNYSIDGGATWQADSIRVSDADFDVEDPPRICCEGAYVYVCWRDKRNGAEDVYFDSSSDGGATWQPVDTRLDVGDVPGASHSYGIEICCGGPNVYVAWLDERNAMRDVYVNWSTDRGSTWQPTDLQLDGGDPPGPGFSNSLNLCCDGAHLYPVWETHDEIYINPSIP